MKKLASVRLIRQLKKRELQHKQEVLLLFFLGGGGEMSAIVSYLQSKLIFFLFLSLLTTIACNSFEIFTHKKRKD